MSSSDPRHHRNGFAESSASLRVAPCTENPETPGNPGRRRLLAASLAGAALALGAPWRAGAQSPAKTATPLKRLPKLTLAGPFATVSYPLIRIAESGALADVADQVEFISWKSPDQLRAMAVNKSADFLAMPSNVPANLYNKGVPLKLLSITIWGILWVLTRDAKLNHIEDLKGQELTMHFKGDMPDCTFRLLAKHAGIDPDKDVKLRYVATSMEALQLLLMRRTDNVLLAEPAVSMGLRKSGSFPVSVIAPELHRGIDIQAEWGRLLKRPPRIPQAGIAMLGPQLGNAMLIERFQQAHAEAIHWCKTHPEECGKMVVKHINMLTPEAVTDAMRADKAELVPASQARPELEFFYRQLMEQQPGLVGGKLPDDGFYYQPTTSTTAVAAS